MLTNTPEVTVLVPAYNRYRLLPTALDSLLQQTEPLWRCIVIDDCSSDGTKSVADNYATRDKRFSVLSLPENRGLGQALNAGVELVETPYFVILDSDDWFEKDTLAVCLGKMRESDESVSMVCGNAVLWQEQPDGALQNVGFQRGQGFTDKYEFFRFGPNLVPRFLRTSTVREVGGFEADPLTQGRMFEDKLLLLKLKHISHFAYVDKPLYNIRLHGDNMTKPETRSKFIEVKRYIYTRMLKEWGDEYEVTFFLHPEGWLDVAELKPKRGRDA